MANPETLCPKCSFSPIPPGAEQCPRCHEVFAFNPLYLRSKKVMVDEQQGLDFEATLMGGLTGAVSAHPAPAATVLALGAALWLIRAAGLIIDLREPTWLFGLAAAELVGATVLMANIGPAVLFAQGLGVVHLAAAFILGAPQSPHTLASASIGVVVLAMTIGEPSRARRLGGLGAGVACACAAAASLAFATDPPAVGPLLIDDLRIGYQLVLPAGWKRMTRPELLPHLPLPSDDLDTQYLGFGSAGTRTFGLLALTSVEDDAKILPACADWVHRLGALNDPQPIAFAAPAPFAQPSFIFDLRLPSGAAGRLACGRAKTRLASLAVVVADPTPGTGAAAFEQVTGGLTLW